VPFVKGKVNRFRWVLVLLTTTAVFLIGNQLLIRGMGVGIRGVENEFFPFYVMVADSARTGRLVLWTPGPMGFPDWVKDRRQVLKYSPENSTLNPTTRQVSF
jgi:hypothetical protein